MFARAAELRVSREINDIVVISLWVLDSLTASTSRVTMIFLSSLVSGSTLAMQMCTFAPKQNSDLRAKIKPSAD
jgi:hypothetical protein